MIRLGLTNWYVTFKHTHTRSGQSTFRVDLLPAAKNYIEREVLNLVEYNPLDCRAVPPIIREPVKHTQLAQLTYQSTYWCKDSGRVLYKLAEQAAYELSAAVVDEVAKKGLMGIEFDRKSSIYACKAVLMQAFETNRSEDDLEIAEFCDVTQLKEQLKRDAQAKREEEERQGALYRWAHNEDMRRRREQQDEKYKEARKLSEEFLKSVLKKNEWEEYQKFKQITVTIPSKPGKKYVIPAATHAKVKEYDVETNKKLAAYCVVFTDYNIPYGDEIAMKVVLLKANPEKFFDIANRF